MWQIIACRAFMGGCAAFIMPSTLSILVNVFPAHERTKAIAIWAGVSGAAGMVGPLLSGWMLGHFWYGSVFLVNVPFILVALGLGVFFVPTSRDPEEARSTSSARGCRSSASRRSCTALIQAPDDGWTGPETIAAFVIAVVFLTAFVLWESHVDEPMLDMKYFRNRAFSTATGGMILVFLSMFGVMFLITQYFQLILGFSPLGSALRFLPIAPVMLIVAPMTPRIAARIGVNRTVALGMSLVSIGFLSFTLLKVDTSYSYVLVCMLVLIGGIALTISPMTASIMSVVPSRRAGAGSAMNDATRELGAALGVAVLGSVAASRYSAGIANAIAPLSPGDQATASASLGAALQTAGRLPQRPRRPVGLGRGARVRERHPHRRVHRVGAVRRARRWPCSSSCPTRSSSTAPCTTRSRPPRTWPSSAWAVRCRSSPTPVQRGAAFSEDAATPSWPAAEPRPSRPRRPEQRSCHTPSLRFATWSRVGPSRAQRVC